MTKTASVAAIMRAFVAVGSLLMRICRTARKSPDRYSAGRIKMDNARIVSLIQGVFSCFNGPHHKPQRVVSSMVMGFVGPGTFFAPCSSRASFSAELAFGSPGKAATVRSFRHVRGSDELSKL
jgi:hypothetical protein